MFKSAQKSIKTYNGKIVRENVTVSKSGTKLQKLKCYLSLIFHYDLNLTFHYDQNHSVDNLTKTLLTLEIKRSAIYERKTANIF